MFTNRISALQPSNKLTIVRRDGQASPAGTQQHVCTSGCRDGRHELALPSSLSKAEVEALMETPTEEEMLIAAVMSGARVYGGNPAGVRMLAAKHLAAGAQPASEPQPAPVTNQTSSANPTEGACHTGDAEASSSTATRTFRICRECGYDNLPLVKTVECPKCGALNKSAKDRHRPR